MRRSSLYSFTRDQRHLQPADVTGNRVRGVTYRVSTTPRVHIACGTHEVPDHIGPNEVPDHIGPNGVRLQSEGYAVSSARREFYKWRTTHLGEAGHYRTWSAIPATVSWGNDEDDDGEADDNGDVMAIVMTTTTTMTISMVGVIN